MKKNKVPNKKHDFITIQYNGAYPVLCSSDLVVFIDGISYTFQQRALKPSGNAAAYIDDEHNEHVNKGHWEIYKWPKEFPENLKPLVEKTINEEIDPPCCGGCI